MENKIRTTLVRHGVPLKPCSQHHLLFLLSDEKDPCGLKLRDILVFWTGADRVPPGGFGQQLQVEFYSRNSAETRRLPSASTCALVIWLPRDVSDPDELLIMLHDAVNMSAGFGKV